MFNFIAFCERQLDKSTDFPLIVSTEYEMSDIMRIVLQSSIKRAAIQNDNSDCLWQLNFVSVFKIEFDRCNSATN